jgi:hypothetical protein
MTVMCWVPKEVEVGNTIAEIHSFRIPLLLRRVAREERY